jgi:5-methyltetrahydrofolate--homocysteine methyltransferase
LAKLIPYIDWTPFFSAWEIKGTYPGVLTDSRYGKAASALHADAEALLRQIVAEGWLVANGVVGLWPANAVDDDDIAIYADETRAKPIATLRSLRQQIARDNERANTALADFIAPKASSAADYIGGFAVTAGIGEEAVAERFARAHDDYSKIMVKALADRLAEAFAEHMHERVRREFWGYAKDEALSPADLIAEKYQGIRPAPGYPAQPDHTEKGTLFDLLDAEQATGIKLTESYAMMPAAAVSGFYFSHPASHYFGVGKIERDQVEDYAKRKGWPVSEAERWLAPILNYDRQTTRPQSEAA